MTSFAVVDLVMSQGNQSSALSSHIVSTSGGEAERLFEDSLLER